VREACARVAGLARSVHIDGTALARLADSLPREELSAPEGDEFPLPDRSDEARAAFVITLDCVNFGSGWFPELDKEPGLSGYRTIETRLLRRFERGPIRAAELATMTPVACADLFGQSLDAPAGELMRLFARGLRELGARLEDTHGGSFTQLLDSAGDRAEALVLELLELPLFRDVSEYTGEPVPLLKRAQIAVADLARALPHRDFSGLERLTLFADNLVPHVLRLEGALRFDPGLVDRIERGELLEHGSPEEVEIRAVAVHAVEQMSERLGAAGTFAPPHRIDSLLWLRGGEPAFKARPRHRARCAYY